MPVLQDPNMTPSIAETLGLAPLDGRAAGAADTLHIRCGSDIYEGLRCAGVRGDYLEYADPLCQGPVPATASDEALRRHRAAFLARWLGGDAEALRRRGDRETAGLWRAPAYARIVIWMEHDPYDQMILARLLAWFHKRHDCRDRVHLICLDRHPEIERFIGLGQLEPRQLAALAGSEKPVTLEQYALGTTVWRALRDPEPTGLCAVAKEGTPSLPAMGPAIERYLREYPSWTDGLSLTERLCLECLAEGAKSPARLFGDVQRRDPLPFLGDAMFWPILEGLSVAAHPAIGDITDIRTPVAITQFGRRLIAGRTDWVANNGIDRWHGGVHLAGKRLPWRWDDAERTVVRTQSH
jgi:hypothetical protein